MPLLREALLGSPHCYLVANRCATGARLLRRSEVRLAFLESLEAVREAFGCRIYVGRIQDTGYQLVLSHAAEAPDDEILRQRWATLGGRSTPPPERLRRRMTTLPGLMQTLGQRASRVLNRRRGSRGHAWEARYRACLLADDAALLAACSWLQRSATAGDSLPSREGPLRLSPPPIIAQPDGAPLPRDESPLGGPPIPPDEAWTLLERFRDELTADDLASYGEALATGWCLGRPESLAEPLARLGRQEGRGRARRLRELDDRMGLCGVWG